MPSSTVKQAKVMSAIAHGWKPKGSVAKIPVKVAKDFHKADAGHKYGQKHKVTAARNTARKYAKKAEGGATEEDSAPDFSQLKKVYINPNEGLAQDLTRKSPIEGMTPPGPQLSAHQDTPRDKLTNLLAGPDTPSYAPRAVLANKAMNVLDFTPPGMAEQAGEDIAKGDLQSAAMFAVPGAKKAKAGFYDLAKGINAAANYAVTNEGPSAGQQYIMKSLKAEYPKDIATKVVEQGYTAEQIDNLKTYMSPGAQKAFDKHYSKLAPKQEPSFAPALWNAPEIQATKPPPFGGGAINMEDMIKVKASLGSNPGGVYLTPNGSKFYIKEGKSEDHVRNEMIAAALYKEAGVPTLNYHPVQGGKHIATEWAEKEKDNAYKFNRKEHEQAANDFAVHAWLANHDAVGTGGDNLGIINGKPTVLDTGGALEYRAQGDPKKNFGASVDELDSMRGLDPKISAPDAAHMFGHMELGAVSDSAMKVVSIPDQKIRDIVAAHGGKPALADKLIYRKLDIAERTGLTTFDPNFIENWHAKRPVAEPKPKGKDTDIEDYYAEMEKHEAGPEWEPDEGFPPSQDIHPHLEGSSPYKQHLQGKLTPVQYTAAVRQHFVPSDYAAYRPKDVKPEEVPQVNWGKNDPQELEKSGVNPHTILLKGGQWPEWEGGPFVPGGYPTEIMDPSKKAAEQSFHMATKPGIAEAYHGNSKMGGPYVAKAQKFFEFDWPSFFGSNHYSDGDLDKVTREARKLGADMVAVHNMHDTGSHLHGLHTQYLVLNTNILRAPHAAFDPNKWHLRHPLAGLAGGGIFTYGALGGEGDSNKMKEGGKVKAEKALPEDHQLGMQVPKGGSMCANCKFLASPTTCGNKGFIEWNGGDKLPHPADEYCCDNYGIKEAEAKAEGGSVKKKDEGPKDHEFIDFKQGGLIDSSIPGRSDHIPMKVPPGSYVLPADIPSALGQGNTKAGSEILSKMFTHSAYGLKPMTQKGHEFHYPRPIGHKHKDGGATEDDAHIITAGGEWIIHPDDVKETGHGDMAKGHKVLDKFVLHTRKQHIKTLRGLKGPKK